MTIWKQLCQPAIHLLNRLGYTEKFTLIWLVSLIALGVLVFILYTTLNQVIQPALRQIEGLKQVESISRFMQVLANHQGAEGMFHARYRQDPEAHARQRQFLQQELQQFKRQLSPELEDSQPFQQLEQHWQQFNKHSLRSVSETMLHYNRMIELSRHLLVVVGDQYAVMQDAEIGTYYLLDALLEEMPDSQRYLISMRWSGVQWLRRQETVYQKHLREVTAQQAAVMLQLQHQLDRVAEHHPAFSETVAQIQHQIREQTGQVLTMTQVNLLHEQEVRLPPLQYYVLLSDAMQATYTQYQQQLLPLAQQIVQQRITEARQVLLISVVIALLLFLLVMYGSVSMYYAMVDNVRRLAGAAREFSAGNLSARARVASHDELRLVGDSLNMMADSFQRMMAQRREDDLRMHAAVEMAMDAVVQINADNVIIGWNAQAERIFGWSRTQALGERLDQLIIPEYYREGHCQALQRFLQTEKMGIGQTRVEFSALRADGSEFPIELTVIPIKLAQGYEFSAFIRDITEKKESDELIWKQANLDALTGLPNRHMFYARLEQDIRQTDRSQRQLALLFIDLDKFKEINDSMGHGVGDLLLIEAANRVTRCVRDSDTVARLGGDEFVVILRDVLDAITIERIAADIINQLITPFELEGQVAHISASIGITLYPNDADDLEGLLKNADQAMYAAKARGRNCFSYFTLSMQQAVMVRQQLVADLHQAVELEQFEVFYQPIMDLVTGRVTRMEALIRWRHPEYGLVNPDRFIPLTEETGMIIEIGDWVFQQAVAQLKYWQQRYNASLQVSINISPVQFQHANRTCDKWLGYLQQAQLSPHDVIFEITEGLLLGVEMNVSQYLAMFRQAGVSIAIDDFGTGYSSLSYLKKYEVDYLKIDRAFVHNLSVDEDSMALPEAIIVMAHKLGLRVVAEGVENKSQQRLLDAAGCDYIQGFLLSPPVPASEFERFLNAD